MIFPPNRRQKQIFAAALLTASTSALSGILLVQSANAQSTFYPCSATSPTTTPPTDCSILKDGTSQGPNPISVGTQTSGQSLGQYNIEIDSSPATNGIRGYAQITPNNASIGITDGATTNPSFKGLNVTPTTTSLTGVNNLNLNSGTGALGMTSGSGTFNFTSGNGPINFNGTGTSDINLTGGGNINITSTGSNSMTSGNGTFNFTSGNGTGPINFNGTGTSDINLTGGGNINITGKGASSIGLTSGTGGMNLNSNNGTFNVTSGTGNFNLFTGDASNNSQINLDNTNDTLSLGNTDTIGANSNRAGIKVRGSAGIILDSGEGSTLVRGYTNSTSAYNNGNAGYFAGLYNGTQTSGLNVQPISTTLGGGGFSNPSLLTLGKTSANLSGGGPLGSNLTLNNYGANFASNTGGYPITVTGVADGVNSYDAVNVRQLNQMNNTVSTGVASVAAMSNIPGLDTNKNFGIGIGYGNFQGNSALAVGINGRLAPSLTAKLSVGAGLSYGATSVGAGLSYAW